MFLILSSFSFSRPADHPDLHSFPHDALPICRHARPARCVAPGTGARPAARARHPERAVCPARDRARLGRRGGRSEEHTSELQSLTNLVCRLLLEKKKKTDTKKRDDEYR